MVEIDFMTVSCAPGSKSASSVVATVSGSVYPSPDATKPSAASDSLMRAPLTRLVEGNANEA